MKTTRNTTQGEKKLIDVCGSARTGKSHTMNAIITSANDQFGTDTKHVQVIAPTGAAASQFLGGQTIHSFLKLRIRKNKQNKDSDKFQDLDEAAAQILEMELSNLKLIIIDEKSMMGKAMLHAIDRRLRQARPAKKDTAFGGISIMITGDFRQLPPVGDSPLYECTPGKTKDEIQGRLLYTLFDKNTIVLSQ